MTEPLEPEPSSETEKEKSGHQIRLERFGGKTAELIEGEGVTTEDLNKGIVVVSIEIAKGANG